MIYIQSNSEKTLPHHFDAACAMYGAIDSSMDFRLVSFDEVHRGKFDNLIKQNLFVGSVEFMNEVFSRIGKTNVGLPRTSNRPFEVMTIKEALDKTSDGSKLFIKSVDIKVLTGIVLDGYKYSSVNSLDPNTKVMAYDVFESKIVSEWRMYVHKNKIVDSHCYNDGFDVLPDYDYAKKVIAENIDFPCSYTLDMGVLENGRNVVVEFNDMWAIGNYGIPNDMYLKLLKDRYFEITELYCN